MFRCLFGHQWGDENWTWTRPGESYYWFKECRRCGKRKKTKRWTLPPSRFVVNERGVLQEVLLKPKGAGNAGATGD